MAEVMELLDHLNRHPEAYLLVGAYFEGMAKSGRKERQLSAEEEAAQDAQAAKLLKDVKMPDWLWKDYCTTQKPPGREN